MMKRALQVILALSIVSIFMISPIAAATSQGLEWGFVIEDRFDFTLTSPSEGLSEQMYMNITSMPAAAISDPLSDWFDIPDPSVGIWWANGTTCTYSLIFFGLLAVGSKIAVPTGNFTLLWELVNVELTDETQEESANVWGIKWSEAINSTHEFSITATYAKADGFLAEYKWETVLTSNGAVEEGFTVIRTNIPSGLDANYIIQLIQENILLVGAGVVILVLLVVVCKKK